MRVWSIVVPAGLVLTLVFSSMFKALLCAGVCLA